jgi:hypothetical protein
MRRGLDERRAMRQRERDAARRSPPFWHRSRLGWANALGFALTVFLALWLLLVVVASFLPDADPVAFPIPTTYILVGGIAHVLTVVMGGVIVLGLMWRGADFSTHTPRLYVFFWTCMGLLFYLVQMVTFLRFGIVKLPNVAPFAEEVYWGSAPIGLAAFALMCYVNIEIPREGEHTEAWYEEHGPEYGGPEYGDPEYGDEKHGDDEHGEYEYEG